MYVELHLNDGSVICSQEITGPEVEAVQKSARDLIEATARGSFVIDGEDGWYCIPTQNIKYLKVVRGEG